MKKSLLQKINCKSNDYSKIETIFKAETGLNLVTKDEQNEQEIKCNESISLIISCYKGDKILPLMLQQIKSQSYQKFEVIIVDDGSPTDPSSLISNAKRQILYKEYRHDGVRRFFNYFY